MIVDGVFSTKSKMSGHMKRIIGYSSPVEKPCSLSWENQSMAGLLHCLAFSLPMLLHEGVHGSRKTRVYLVRVPPIYLISQNTQG